MFIREHLLLFLSICHNMQKILHAYGKNGPLCFISLRGMVGRHLKKAPRILPHGIPGRIPFLEYRLIHLILYYTKFPHI